MKKTRLDAVADPVRRRHAHKLVEIALAIWGDWSYVKSPALWKARPAVRTARSGR